MDPFMIALMEDGLDELLAEVPDGTESQGNEWMNSDDEEELLMASHRAEQQGGNPLFAVNMQRIRTPRLFQQGTAIQFQARFLLQQLRPPNSEFQGEAIAEAFYQGLVNFVRDPDNGINNPEDYSMSMAVHHSTGTQTWTNTARIPLTEWMKGSDCMRGWLEQLAKQLNSIQSFNAVNGEFYAELSFFRTEQRGGRPEKKQNRSTIV